MKAFRNGTSCNQTKNIKKETRLPHLVQSPHREDGVWRVDLVVLSELSPVLHGFHEYRVVDNLSVQLVGRQPGHQDRVLVQRYGLDIRGRTRY